MHELQAAGVAAARMLRVSELPDFAYFRERDFYRVERHPYLAEPVVAERNHARGAALDDALSAPAPLAGEHTKALVGAWLGLSEVEVEALVDAGVLEPLEPQIADELRNNASTLSRFTAIGARNMHPATWQCFRMRP